MRDDYKKPLDQDELIREKHFREDVSKSYNFNNWKKITLKDTEIIEILPKNDVPPVTELLATYLATASPDGLEQYLKVKADYFKISVDELKKKYGITTAINQ